MTTRDVVAPGMRAAAVDMCGDDEADRLFTAETRELMGFFVMLRRLLFEVYFASPQLRSNSH